MQDDWLGKPFGDYLWVSSLLSKRLVSSLHQPPKNVHTGLGGGLSEMGEDSEPPRQPQRPGACAGRSLCPPRQVPWGQCTQGRSLSSPELAPGDSCGMLTRMSVWMQMKVLNIKMPFLPE